MKRKLVFYTVWVCITAALLYNYLQPFWENEHIAILNREITAEIISNIQRICFVGNVVFAIFMHFNKKLFLEPMQMVRYGKNLFSDIVMTGIEYALIFVVNVYTVIAAEGFYLRLKIDLAYLTDIGLVFAVVLQMYLVYTLLYMLLEQPAVAQTIQFVLYLGISAFILSVQYIQNDLAYTAPIFYQWWIMLLVDAVLCAVLYGVIVRKDFVGRQTQ